MELMLPTASFTPAELYDYYKLPVTPIMFWGNHISVMVLTLLLCIQFNLIFHPSLKHFLRPFYLASLKAFFQFFHVNSS